MTQGERVKEVRKALGLTLESFGERIGLKKSGLSLIENGRNDLTEANAKAICREFNVNESWLRAGEGEMFANPSEDEEIANLVSDILEDGKNNPLFSIILDIVQAFNELSPQSQRALLEFSKILGEKMNMKKED